MVYYDVLCKYCNCIISLYMIVFTNKYFYFVSIKLPIFFIYSFVSILSGIIHRVAYFLLGLVYWVRIKVRDRG